jgi:polysaccharide chain length determinant protein (PEP-CTERM system associated)
VPEPENNISDTIEQVLGIVTRGRWWILGAACCIPVAVVAVAMSLPDQYFSQATLLVVPQQISQRYVESDNTTTIPAAVQAMTLEVLSTGQLIRIIDDFGLYDDPKEQAMSLRVDRMRKEVEIDPLETTPGHGDFNAFTISFTATTPRLAQEVTSRLTSLFIEQNQRAQGEKAANTTKFLSDQLDAAKQRLAAQDQRLQAFKTSNLGELLPQQQANLMALTDSRAKLGTVAASLLQAQKQQLSVESALNERLSRLQSNRTEMLARFTEKYPPVVEKDREIAKVQVVLARVRAGTSTPGKSEDADTPDDPALAGVIQQAEANIAEIESLSRQQDQLQADCRQYQARLNLTPVGEQQLAEILREDELFKQDYENLEKQKIQSRMTTSLEENQQGQQFRLVDPPTLPLKPSGPKRLKISLGGMAGGVAMGLVLAFLMDIRTGSFHSERALSRSISLPLVLGVPLVLTPGERHARGWRIAFEWLVGSAMTLAMFAAEFYVFRHG